MTQNITETSNNSLYSLLQQPANNNSDASCMSNPNNFSAIIEKTQESQDVSEKDVLTIADIKSLKNIQNDDTADFRKFLMQEIQEVNDESSLDLTLTEDVGDFIEQLQSQEIEVPTETKNKDEVEVISETATEQETDILSATEDTVALLSNVNIDFGMCKPIEVDVMKKLSELEDTALKNAQLISLEDSIFQADILTDDLIKIESNTNISTLTDNLSETVSELITDNTTKSVQEPTIDEPEISDEMLRELNVESVEAETETSYQDNSDMQQQTPEEHVIKAMINLDDVNSEFESNVNEVQKTTNVSKNDLREASAEKILEQISKHCNGIKANSKVNIVLNPENLGKVSVHVAKSAEGMSAQFTVSTNEAKEILLKNLDGLKETLLSHGVNADNISVKMNESQKSEYREDWTEQNQNHSNNNKEQQRQQREGKGNDIFKKIMSFVTDDETEEA